MKLKTFLIAVVCLFIITGCAIPETKQTVQEYADASPVWAILPSYSAAESFVSGVALVEDENAWYFINPSDEIALEIPYKAIYNTILNTPMSDGVAHVYNDPNEQFLLLRTGHVVPYTPTEYKANPYHSYEPIHKNSLFPMGDAQTGLYGYNNKQSLWYISPIYTNIKPFYKSPSVARIGDASSRDFIVYNDGSIIEFPSELILGDVRGDSIVSHDFPMDYSHSIEYFSDVKGKNIFDKEFHEARPFSEGLAAVAMDDLWGFIDESGEWVVQPTYNRVEDFNEGLAEVENSRDQYAFINKTGEIVIPFSSNEPTGRFTSGLCPVSRWDSYGVMDKKGNWIIQPKHDSAYVEDTYIRIENNRKYEIYCIEPKLSLNMKFDDIEEFTPHLLSGEQGEYDYLIDTLSGVIYDKPFLWLEAESEGLILAHDIKTGLIGFIDETAAWIIEPQFEKAEPFSNGLAAVKLNGKWGYVANPLVYSEWVSDEWERGGYAGLYEKEQRDEEAIVDDILDPIAAVIGKITEESIDDIWDSLKLGDFGIKKGMPLTREDAAVIAASAAKYCGITIECYLAFLQDEAEVQEEKLHHVSWAACFGLLDCKTPGYFEPTVPITVREAQTMSLRLYEVCLDIE